MPERIQLRRTRGWRKPEGAIVVARPSGWGNPFKVGEPFRFFDKDGQLVMGVCGSRTSAVSLFERYMAKRVDMYPQIRRELGGHDLACWCPPGPCHADVLLKIANGEAQ